MQNRGLVAGSLRDAGGTLRRGRRDSLRGGVSESTPMGHVCRRRKKVCFGGAKLMWLVAVGIAG